jgi:TolA-binding protein
LSKLRLAKQLAEQGKRQAAVKWLRDCVRLYPETKAAKEARDLLGPVDSGKE